MAITICVYRYIIFYIYVFVCLFIYLFVCCGVPRSFPLNFSQNHLREQRLFKLLNPPECSIIDFFLGK